jgi:serine/threonine protein kinase/Tfp pilus assembly protein PilF
MTAAQLETIKEIFNEALDCEPDTLGAFLETACRGNDSLRHEVQSFLTAHQHAGTFIEVPMAGLVANIIEHEQHLLLTGQTIGHYKVEKRIDAGGMGEVYFASDTISGRRAALKFLPAHLIRDPERLKRFQQEARVVTRLNHPNILTIYEVGTDNSTHYIASELIEGETLRQRIAREHMQVSEAIEVTIQIASALAAAHETGVVHRDIKPENIMLRADGYVKVLDFGIAKLAEQELADAMAQDEGLKLVETNVGSILGTVSYMSPEQAHPAGRRIDKRTDIWSLGVVLYEIVTGRAPFTGATAAGVITSILTEEPSSLSSYIAKPPGELQQIISKALQKDPAQRYQSTNEMIEPLKALRRKLEVTADLARSITGRPWLRWTRSPTGVAIALLAGALALLLPFYRFRNPTQTVAPEKSIAVLPFENLSDDKESSHFADGIQDEILSDLARVADLKVISRTSVMAYKSGLARNLREIGRQLGAANVVEGSVERSGNRVRINAQLIDARNDRHLWGQTYDRDLSDVFIIQSEIAKTIAEQLQAKLSPAEKKAIERPPTNDLIAFDLYTRAKNLLLGTAISSTGKTDSLQAVGLLNDAVARDPLFFDAYCQLAYAHDTLYFSGWGDHTPARLAFAEAAIQAAFHLRPDAGEAHLARASNLYRGYLDYEGALAELEVARQILPNDPQVFELKGFIERRQGHWEQSTRDLERTVDLDPRNVFTLQQIALSYLFLRRYADEKMAFDRVSAIVPNDAVTQGGRAGVEFDWKGDTRPLHQTIDSIRATNPGATSSVADAWLMCALAERDAVAAADALMAFGENRPALTSDNVSLTRLSLQGVIARMTNADAKARAAFLAARVEQEKIVQAQPNYGPALCVLGLIDAGLGRKEEAIREGRRAVELLPVEKDSINGPAMIKYLAIIAAWIGDKDLACEQLAIAIHRPGALTYGQLKLLPFWDPLRGDPRFEKIVASLAPDALKQ